MGRFLSCDWGTTSFRLRLIETDSLRVIGEVKTDQGIAATFKQWEHQGGHREGFYAGIIFQNRLKLSEHLGERLDKIPVILSGMASSTIGMEDMPYKLLPFNLDGSNLQVKLLVMDKTPFIIISGACTANDVMRGEETKLIGCAMALPKTGNEKLILMPGTHPKHVFVKGDQAIGFKTFMTGEFFDLLSRQSVLAASVSINTNLASAENSDSFIAGVKAGQTTNLLHAAFMVRTNQVLKKMSAQQNYHYLSGLLIGAELKDIKAGTSVCLVGDHTHLTLYTLACEIVGLSVLKKIDADDALVKGQRQFLKKWFLDS